MLTFKNWFLSFTFKQRIIAITIFVLVVSALGYVVLKKQAPSAIDTSSDIRIVQVASVSSLGDSSVPLMLSGDVKSLSEANIKAEASGRVTHVYKKIGDTVLAGEVIAEIEHSRELASLDQAKAALEQAKISQSISDISQGSSDALLKEALNSTINTLRSTYDGVEDIVRNKFDPLFSNPTSESPTFNIVSSNSQLVNDLNSERLKVQSILNEEHERRSKLSTDNDLLAEINVTVSELADIKNLVDMVNTALNSGIPGGQITQATIDADKVVASASRTSWSALMVALSAAKDNLTSKTASYQITQNQGSSSTTVTTSGAAIAQAESGVQLALVALEKTIIRSPILGTLNSLSLSEGDFVSPTQPAATVSNNGALEIVAYVTDLDRRNIVVGNTVKIGDEAEGVVTRVAPALDPLTKKIEVHIGLTKGLNTILNGQSVSLSISRSKELISAPAKNDQVAISIPIVSLKITPDGPVVFTVESDLLKSHRVKIGALLGDHIVVTEGLTSSMEIVTDARGFKDGQKVQVTQ